MHYILFVIVTSMGVNSGVAISQGEFATAKACEIAGDALHNNVGILTRIKTTCVSKE